MPAKQQVFSRFLQSPFLGINLRTPSLPAKQSNWIVNPTPLGSLTAKSVIGSSVDEDFLDRLAWTLSTVADELEQIPDPEFVVQHAVTRFKLVVDLSAKTFFWKGEEFKDCLLYTSDAADVYSV